MFTSKLLISGLIALGLAFTPVGVLAAEPHAHTGAVEIKLDNGRKWPTDEVLCRGMGEIRIAMADALIPIHRNAFSAGAYEALAARVQAQVAASGIGECPPWVILAPEQDERAERSEEERL